MKHTANLAPKRLPLLSITESLKLVHCLFWAWVAILKAFSFDQLAETIRSVFFLSQTTSFVLAICVVVAEALIALLIMPRKTTSIAATLIILLSFSFLAIHAMKMAFHISVPCSCFGTLYKLHPVFSILVNLVCIASGMYILSKRAK